MSEIVSGGLILESGDLRVQAGTVQAPPITETWTVGNTPNSMSGDWTWTPYIGSNAWGVVSQALQLDNTGGGAAQGGRLEVNLGTTDYRVTAQITQFTNPTGTLVASVCARMQGDPSITFYALDLLGVSGSYSLLLLRFLNGGQTTLGSVALGAPSGPVSIALQVQNSVTPILQGFYNGTRLINTTDPGGITTGAFAGIQGAANGAGNRVIMDTFQVTVPSGSGGAAGGGLLIGESTLIYA